jgi:anti-anti-sigma factor
MRETLGSLRDSTSGPAYKFNNLQVERCIVIFLLNKTNPKQGLTVLRMQGSINSGPDCRRLEQETETLIGAKQTFVIFDLSDVTHIDSSAIGSIVRCYSRLKTAGGLLRLAGCTGMIDASIRLTQLDRVLELYPTASAAAENFPPGQ